MQNPFGALGLANGADAEQVRAAYHARVKLCHPDRMQDEAQKRVAQDELIQLNLAYAEALRQASDKVSRKITIPDAKQVAKRLLDQGLLDSALRILSKASCQDAEWYSLKGNILLKKGEPQAAHACFKMAIKLDPENACYHRLALDAGVLIRKQKTLRGRMTCWARNARNVVAKRS